MNQRPRLFVTGAAGMVGNYVQEVFRGWQQLLTDVVGVPETLDVTRADLVMEAVKPFRPDVLLHLAALTDVDRCQQEPQLAYEINTQGSRNVALACKAVNATLVYISSGSVFWGDKPDPYTEEDTPRPRNIYGHSKLQAERILDSLVQRHFTVRAGWMIGGGLADKKFVGKITRMILQGRKNLKAVDDKFGSPTYARDLLTGIRHLLQTEDYGIYNMVNNGMVSRYEITLAICDILGKEDIEVQPVSSAEFPLPAPRARSEALCNKRLELAGLNTMPDWDEAMRHYLLEDLVPALQNEEQQGNV